MGLSGTGLLSGKEIALRRVSSNAGVVAFKVDNSTPITSHTDPNPCPPSGSTMYNALAFSLSVHHARTFAVYQSL